MTPPTSDWLARRLVEGAAEAILFADVDGLVRAWNPGAEAMFGWPAAEILGKTMDVIIPERLRGRHWHGWRKVIETGVTRYSGGDLLAVPAVRKDGTGLSIEFSIQLVRDDGGAVLGFGAVVRDVTERWHKEKALRLRLKELEAKVGGERA
ncbi:MAG: PAS domain-containing protein [Anaeromyxobacteraceae bacterium]